MGWRQCAGPGAKRPWWPAAGPARARAARFTAAALLAVAPWEPASAHAGHPHPPTLATAVSATPWLLVPLTAWVFLYAAGLRRLWGRAGVGAGVGAAGATAAGAGVVVLLFATTWPLDAYGE